MKSLFRCWDTLKNKLTNRTITLFLDYDGTLTPIVNRPEEALISCDVKELLIKLSKSPRCKLAIISGRALKDIKNIIGIKGIVYSGNHGLEVEGPRIKSKSPVSSEYKAILRKIKDNLHKKISPIKGSFIEDKGLSLALHYRLVNKSDIPKIKTIFYETISPYLINNKIKTKCGKMVLEIRPPLEWDKGKVVLWILDQWKNVLNKNAFLPIYIGDDKTDEDAFRVLKNRGLTIFVGKPRFSYAEYYLRSNDEVREFLERILLLQKGINNVRTKKG